MSPSGKQPYLIPENARSTATVPTRGRGPRLLPYLLDRVDLVSIAVLLILLLVVYVVYYPGLLSLSSTTILSAQFLPLIFAAVAQSIVMLVGGIDLSVGAQISLVMVTFALLARHGMLLALAIAVVVSIVVGAANGLLVSIARLPPIIVTLAASFLWGGAALWIMPQPGGSVAQSWVDAYNNGWHGIAVPGVVVVVVMLAWVVVRKSRFGLSLYAVGGNSHGAFANGLKVRKIKIGAYALAGVFAGLAGVGLAVQTGTGDPNLGNPYTLNSIAAAVLGGISFFGGVGKLAGAVMGALVIGVLSNLLLVIGVSPFYQLVLQGAVLIAAIGVRTLITVGRTTA